MKRGRFTRFAVNWLSAILQVRPQIAVLRLPRYFWDWFKYRHLSSDGQRPKLLDTYPCLADRSDRTPFDPHYFYQSAWLARRLKMIEPDYHVDVGSSIMLISVVSAWLKTIFVDYRPLNAQLHGLLCVSGTLTRLPFADHSVDSLSCLHVIEHIGLGRYGDPLDCEGATKAAIELMRVLKSGGKLYLSTPVGRERVCFNAHRVFSPERITSMFPEFSLAEFSLVDDEGNYHEKASLREAANCEYGCGLFVLERRSPD